MSINDLFTKPLIIINMGLETFYQDLKTQQVDCIHVNWSPKAGGDPKMLSLLNKLNRLPEHDSGKE